MFILLLLSLLACTPAKDTGDSSPDTGDSSRHTGDSSLDTGESCEDLAPIVLDCEARVQAAVGSAGGYYDAIDSDDPNLVDALADLIDDHHRTSFDNLWGAFPTTDARSDGTVWDVYSDVPGGDSPYTYTFSDQCGQYQGEGECFNREHTWPSIWFGGGSPMKSDLFHVIPTDGYVNNMRGSYPFGIVGEPNWTSENGSVRGVSRQCGFSRSVFEPIDAYKGDLARGMLYFSTRYRNEDSGFDTSYATDGARLEPWAEELLKAWHIQDPVDAKEAARNEAIHGIQDNRNPFIDHPEWVCQIEDF